MTLRINLWSGPRNVSTALMYAFAQRPDTRVVDEPLYAHYLRMSGVEHPGRDEVLAAQEADGERVVREVILGDYEEPVVFFKQMAHHLVELDRGFLLRCANVLLIRDPAEVLATIVRQLPAPRLEDLGIACQRELFDELVARGKEPPVLDARELLLDPESVLRQLCARMGLAFHSGMLAWPSGPRPEDGVWARHWYQNVHRSTGFAPYRAKEEPPPTPVLPVLDQARPHYLALLSHALRAQG
ncbi:MAG: sulfotransferase family protein [Thermoanaerobaculia bacterium]